MDQYDLTSPAAALAAQARMDAQAEAALTGAMERFLVTVKAAALDEGLHVSPALFAQAWRDTMSADALTGQLGLVMADYLAQSLLRSSIPEEAYESAMAVLTRASEQQWSATDREKAMNAALSIEGGETFLTAAAPVVKRDADGRPIYRRTAKLDEGGMAWKHRARMEARTGVTGLHGKIVQGRMQAQGYPYKMWVTRRDAKVRDTHADADYQTVAVGSMFEVGGYPMEYPGDRGAPAGLVINCRCVMVAVGTPRQGSPALTFLAP